MATIRLFGSTVRGDGDQHSDTDVLVAYKSRPDAREKDAVAFRIAEELGCKPDIAHYSVTRIMKFFASGDLFAWHLYQESRPIMLSDSDFVTSLSAPMPYISVERDMQSFISMLREIPQQLITAPNNYAYEAGLLYLTSRNIGMAASYGLGGKIDFSRLAALNISTKLEVEFPFSQNEYATLISCRHASQRGAPIPSCPPNLNRRANSLVEWSMRIVAAMKSMSLETKL